MPRSLRAIHDFRLSHPGATQELAHLKVLEGMIYLQSGRFGLAAAVAPEVAEAGQHLRSTDGRAPRDALFAKNFPALLAGWQATRAEQRDWRTFQTSADAISESLRQVQQLPPEQRARIEADEGALYLATTAAVFYTWAAREIALSHDRAEAPAKIREWYRSAHDLIGAFLTPAEKAAHIQQDLSVSPNATPPQGRLRYIDWYHWLGRALNSPPSPAAPSR